MTITGRQIRDARALLGLQRNRLAARAKTVSTAAIIRAESVDGDPPITAAQVDAIRKALERAGVEFAHGDVRLRAGRGRC